MGTICMPSLAARWFSARSTRSRVPLLVVVLALVGVRLTLGQHQVDQSGQFVGSGSDGFGFVHA